GARNIVCLECVVRLRDEVPYPRQHLLLITVELRRIDLGRDLIRAGEPRIHLADRLLFANLHPRRDQRRRGGGRRWDGRWRLAGRGHVGRPRRRARCAGDGHGGDQQEEERPPHGRALTGSRTMTFVPWPTVERISMLPWWRSITRRTRARPMPVPSVFVV